MTALDRKPNIERMEKGYRVESTRTKGVYYFVHFSRSLGFYVCSCPDFRLRRMQRGEICKHISQVWDLERYSKTSLNPEIE
jgi:predicted nucleic acid-binding Zn finger protein